MASDTQVDQVTKVFRDGVDAGYRMAMEDAIRWVELAVEFEMSLERLLEEFRKQLMRRESGR